MKKKHPDHESNRIIIMFIVGIVAVIAILSASSNNRNLGGEAIFAPECEVEEYCKEWKWNSETDMTCLDSDFVTYKECSSYSWPLDKDENPVMKCDSWNIIYKNECIEWEFDTEWERECVEWGTNTNC